MIDEDGNLVIVKSGKITKMDNSSVGKWKASITEDDVDGVERVMEETFFKTKKEAEEYISQNT